MKTYYSLQQEAPVNFNEAWYEQIQADYSYGGSGETTSDVLARLETDLALQREINQKVKDRLIED
jgi:ABC-type sulfate transport system substrate-binding protein